MDVSIFIEEKQTLLREISIFQICGWAGATRSWCLNGFSAVWILVTRHSWFRCTEITGTRAEKAQTGAEQEPPSPAASVRAAADAAGGQPGQRQRFLSRAQILHTNIQPAAADAALEGGAPLNTPLLLCWSERCVWFQTNGKVKWVQ